MTLFSGLSVINEKIYIIEISYDTAVSGSIYEVRQLPAELTRVSLDVELQ